VFHTIGIHAEPFSCRVVIFNRPFVDKSKREGRIPQTPAEVHEWTSDGVSWSLGVGWPATHLNGWPGHLVAMVGDTLVDASIEQANRPEKGIVLPPVLAAKAPEPFRLGREKFYLHSPDGLLIYEPIKDRSWKNAPDWINPKRHRRAILRILTLLEMVSRET
jgi:hypothetical protein